MIEIISVNRKSKLAIGTITMVIAFLWIATPVGAQSFNVQGDLVSSYVWRGQYQTGASVQPTLGFSAGGFSLTAWGSVDITGKNKKEVDLTAAYTIKGLTISVTDYWWAGEQVSDGVSNNSAREKYFMFKSHRTDHIFEGGLSYALPCKKFPLSLSWFTMFGGGDKKIYTENGMDKSSKQAYSTYVEMNYPFNVKGIGLNATLGFTPWDAPMYGTREFAVTNIALKATKEIRFNERFSLPIYSQIIWNPNKEDVHLVFGITLR